MPSKGMSSECVAHQWLVHRTWKALHLGTSNLPPCRLGRREGMNSTFFTQSLFVLPVLWRELGRRVLLSVRELFPVVLKFEISQVCIPDPECSALELYI